MIMKNQHSLTDKELQDYADHHIQYEVDMLTYSAGTLGFLAPHGDQGFLPWVIKNGLLNSFSLHARNLINFLYSGTVGNPRSTDVIIEDYVDAGIVSDSLIPITKLCKKAITKANKQVAHLTLERIQYEQANKEWEFKEISKDIYKAFTTIVPHIPNSRISDSFRQKLMQSDVQIPIVDISSKEMQNRTQIALTFSLRMSPDGENYRRSPPK